MAKSRKAKNKTAPTALENQAKSVNKQFHSIHEQFIKLCRPDAAENINLDLDHQAKPRENFTSAVDRALNKDTIPAFSSVKKRGKHEKAILQIILSTKIGSRHPSYVLQESTRGLKTIWESLEGGRAPAEQ